MRTTPGRPRRAVRRPRGYVVFLGFPLIWLVSTSFKAPQESRSTRRSSPLDRTLSQLHRRA